MRTVFNLLGPLANPAGAEVQVVGVSEARLVKLVAEAMAQLGTRRALVVHGSDGLDEITTTGPTLAAEVVDGRVTECTLEPGMFGVARAAAPQLAGGDRRENAAIIRTVLSGENGARRDIVVLNAAAALMTAGLAQDLAEGIPLARKSIDSGRAMETLDRFVRFARHESA